jgi:hypothetical protein
VFSNYTLYGPYRIKGKGGEPEYECYELDLGDIWVEGPRKPGDETYWE